MNPPRHVLVTGASRGIGRAVAEHFLARGDIVTGCSRGATDLDAERYHHVHLDVADEAAVEALFADVRRFPARLDVLINNAGIASMNPVALTPLTSVRRVLETNFLGPFLFTRNAIRLLRHADHARVVNVTTVAVPWRLDGEAIYAASKAAIEQFTRIVAKEVGSFGITCNAVGPNVIDTQLTRGIGREKIDALVARQAIARRAEPADVINVIDFFLRPESDLITGQIVYLGGAG